MHRFLLASAEKYPTHPAISIEGQLISYAELNTLTDSVAAALYMTGFAEMDRASIYLPNSPQFVIAYFGILKAGGILNVVNPYASPDQLQQQLANYQAETIFVGSNLYNKLKKIQAQTPILRVICSSGQDFLPSPRKVFFSRSKNLSSPCPVQAGDMRFADFLKLGAKSNLPNYTQPSEDICGEFSPISYKLGQVTTMYQALRHAKPLLF